MSGAHWLVGDMLHDHCSIYLLVDKGNSAQST